VIHRDIKPSNLFLQEDGRTKVMDFGIARLPSSRLTLAGRVLGTPNYMAPEQIMAQPTDARSDLFSAAIAFFELVTRAHPFQAEVILERIVEGEPDSIFDHTSSAPAPMEKIFSKALRKRPEDRYQSAAEMAADVRAVLDGMRQNASPTMSHVELPSERGLPRSERTMVGDVTQLRAAPAGEDEAEWRLSEVLRLIPEFEDAVEARDQQRAADTLRGLQAIAAIDRRFVEAADSSELTYLRVWPADRGVQTGASGTSTETAIQAGAPASAAKPSAAAKPRRLSSQTTQSKRTFGSRELAIGVVLGLTVLIIVAALFTNTSGAALETAVAQAEVVGSGAYVRNAAADSGAVVAQVASGATLNLLELPGRRDVSWVRAQYVPHDGKATEAGFVLVSQLDDWSKWKFQNNADAVALARAMAPSAGASESDLNQYIERSEDLARRLGSPYAEQLQTATSDARAALAALRSPASDHPAVESPTSAEAPAGAVPPVPEETPIPLILRRGENALRAGDYSRARRAANQVLAREPGNLDAQDLLQRAKMMEELDAPSR
jgi:hypothetical protein